MTINNKEDLEKLVQSGKLVQIVGHEEYLIKQRDKTITDVYRDIETGVVFSYNIPKFILSWGGTQLTNKPYVIRYNTIEDTILGKGEITSFVDHDFIEIKRG